MSLFVKSRMKGASSGEIYCSLLTTDPDDPVTEEHCMIDPVFVSAKAFLAKHQEEQP